MDFIRHLPQHPTAVANLPNGPATVAAAAAVSAAAAAGVVYVEDRLLPPECLLPFYPESFAVDPNEVFKKDCMSAAAAAAATVKDEATAMDENRFFSYDWQQCQVKSEPNSPLSSSSSSLASLVSHYSGAGGNMTDANDTMYEQKHPSLLPHFQRPQRREQQQQQERQEDEQHQLQNVEVKLEVEDNLGLEMPSGQGDYDAMEEDVDLTGFHLNEQDFHSIRSIVEQTFRDGRDMLDIIEAV
jgi:hypothetical protein